LNNIRFNSVEIDEKKALILSKKFMRWVCIIKVKIIRRKLFSQSWRCRKWLQISYHDEVFTRYQFWMTAWRFSSKMMLKLGIISLCLALFALFYPNILGVMGYVHSDKLNVFTLNIIDIFNFGNSFWVNNVPHSIFQKITYFILELPIFKLFFGISWIFLMVHFLFLERGKS